MDPGEYAAELERRVPDGFDVIAATPPQEERRLLESARVATGLTIDEDAIVAATNLELFAWTFAAPTTSPWI